MKDPGAIKEGERRMNMALKRLGIPLTAMWRPDPQAKNRAVITQGRIKISDQTEEDAWGSLIHEILEYRLQPLLSLHRNLINVLIQYIENYIYQEKERLLENLPTQIQTLLQEVKHTRQNKNLETEHF